MILAACARSAMAADEMKLELPPSDLFESCHLLNAGDEIHYSFRGSSVVLFDMHYHDGDNVKYLIPEHLAFKKNESFKARFTQHYCLAWTNSQTKPITIRYTIDVVNY
jgi:hypothetical protein